MGVRMSRRALECGRCDADDARECPCPPMPEGESPWAQIESLKAQLSSARDALEAVKAELKQRDFYEEYVTAQKVIDELRTERDRAIRYVHKLESESAVLVEQRDEAKADTYRSQQAHAECLAQLSAARAEVEALKTTLRQSDLLGVKDEDDNTALRTVVAELCDALNDAPADASEPDSADHELITRARALCEVR